MKRYVLDSYAVIAYLEREEGHEKVSAIFDECVTHDERAIMSMVNWGEVFYITMRTGGEKMATLALDTLRALPVEIVPIDAEITLQAARFKAAHKMSYADAFAAALAKERKARLVTGDKEFIALASAVDVLWLVR